MIPLRLDFEGQGSHAELVKYVDDVLKENTYVAWISVSAFGETELRNKLARGIVYSILHRLGAQGDECAGGTNDMMRVSADDYSSERMTP